VSIPVLLEEETFALFTVVDLFCANALAVADSFIVVVRVSVDRVQITGSIRRASIGQRNLIV